MSSSNGKHSDHLTRTLEAWAEHEQRRLYRQSSLSFADERFQWVLDHNLEAINSPNPWTVVAPRRATISGIPLRSTAPIPNTNLDEFGYCFRSQLTEVQCLVVVSHFEGYETLATLRIIEGDRQWEDWMRYWLTLSTRKEELSKIIAVSWLALRLAWRRRRNNLNNRSVR